MLNYQMVWSCCRSDRDPLPLWSFRVHNDLMRSFWRSSCHRKRPCTVYGPLFGHSSKRNPIHQSYKKHNRIRWFETGVNSPKPKLERLGLFFLGKGFFDVLLVAQLKKLWNHGHSTSMAQGCILTPQSGWYPKCQNGICIMLDTD
jgi:hypothetical protein